MLERRDGNRDTLTEHCWKATAGTGNVVFIETWNLGRLLTQGVKLVRLTLDGTIVGVLCKGASGSRKTWRSG